MIFHPVTRQLGEKPARGAALHLPAGRAALHLSLMLFAVCMPFARARAQFSKASKNEPVPDILAEIGLVLWLQNVVQIMSINGNQSIIEYRDEVGFTFPVLDLAWPNGLQEELSQPVAVLLNEDAATVTLASQAGFRCFTEASAFKRYVKSEVLAEAGDA